jgi:periplasmic divalent cation tolerance protein
VPTERGNDLARDEDEVHGADGVGVDARGGASPGEVLLVVTTVPDRHHADTIARALVDEGLAACVSILAPATSVYRWRGAVETAQELPLLVKTARSRFDVLRERLAALHPYEVPEILALPVAGGLPAYLRWVLEETAPGVGAGGEGDAAAAGVSPAASSVPRPARNR